ncbi:hypothetical protein V7S43_008447 [Phytophthora oleae]|uniref:Uncharacterized protein n=1 Tax=Phytophthora oleae TaxID=2107226 RepID=A0ABD3FP95_9STRA
MQHSHQYSVNLAATVWMEKALVLIVQRVTSVLQQRKLLFDVPTGSIRRLMQWIAWNAPLVNIARSHLPTRFHVLQAITLGLVVQRASRAQREWSALHRQVCQ